MSVKAVDIIMNADNTSLYQAFLTSANLQRAHNFSFRQDIWDAKNLTNFL